MADMTLHQLLTNPSGPGGGFLAARYRIIDDLNKRFVNLATGKEFRHAVYRDGTRVVFHVQVPTESEGREFFWDVVVEAHSDSPTAKAILASPVHVFSNSPSFVFTYAYVANQGGLIVKWLKDKIPAEVYRKAPDVRNPIQQMGFEKTVYFACQWILRMRLYDPEAEEHLPLRQAEVSGNVDSFEDISVKYNRMRRASSRERRAAKAAKAAAAAEEKREEKEALRAERLASEGRSLAKTSVRAKSVRRTSPARRAATAKRPKKR